MSSLSAIKIIVESESLTHISQISIVFICTDFGTILKASITAMIFDDIFLSTTLDKNIRNIAKMT